MEARRALKEDLRPGIHERLAKECRLGQVLLGQLTEALLTIDGHKDGDHHGNQCLIGADVGGRLFAADVLLAGAERQHEAALAVDVLGLADQAAGHLAQELLLAGDDAAIRSAKTNRHAKALGFQRDNIGLSRRLDDAQRDGFGNGDDQQGTLAVNDLGDCSHVLDDPKEVGRLDQNRGGVILDGRLQRGQIHAARLRVVVELTDVDALVLRRGPQHLAVLRMHGPCHRATELVRHAAGHQHALRGTGRAVVHGGVGDLHAGKLTDHGLELKHGRERALCDLGLVGRVAGEELATLHERIDHHRTVVPIGSRTQEARKTLRGGQLRELACVTGGQVGRVGLETLQNLAL